MLALAHKKMKLNLKFSRRCLPIISATDNAFAVEANAPNKLLVAF